MVALGRETIIILWFLLIWLFPFIEGSFGNENQKINFYGMEVKLLGYQYPPILSYKRQKDGNYSFEGLIYELLGDVQKYFNIRLQYSVVDEGQVTKYGLISALIKHLDDKDVDVAPYMFDQEINNLQHMELTSTLFIDPVSILQPWPPEESRLRVTVRPFQLMVWIGFVGSTALFILVTSAMIKVEENVYEPSVGNPKSVGETIYSQFAYVLTIIFSQDNSISYQAKTSFKILVGLWLLCMVVLIYAYTGVMTALLTVPKLEPIANTLEEVVAQNKSVTLERNTPMLRILLDATDGFEKQIGNRLREDPSLWAKDPLSAVNNAKTLVNYAVYLDTKANNGKCRITASPELGNYKALPLQLGLPFGSPFVYAFNNFFLRLNAAGIVELSVKRYFPTTDKCRTDISPESNPRSLTLLDLTPAFFILGIGLSLSILTFLTESCINCFYRKKARWY